jgi:hypothetical protein
MENVSNMDYEIIVVDNASTDGTAEVIRSEFAAHRELHFIRNSQNRMYAAANNIGYENSRGRHICFLNTDTEVLRNTMEPLLEFLRSHPRAGMAAGRFMNSDGSLQRLYRRFPNLGTIFFNYTHIGKLADHWFLSHSFQRNYLYGDKLFNRPTQVDQVGTACAVLPRRVLEEIGPFDDRFRLYFNDVDLCRRLKQSGWETWVVPSAMIIHYGSRSTSLLERQVDKDEFLQGLFYYFRKHHTGIRSALVALMFPVESFRRYLNCRTAKKRQI